MSTEADPAGSSPPAAAPVSPPVPPSPPRPAAPPRPGTPPHPAEPPRPAAGPSADGDRDAARPPVPEVPARSPQPPPPTGDPIVAPRRAPAPAPAPGPAPATRPPVPATGPAVPGADPDDLAGPPTFRLRPVTVERRRPPARVLVALACLVLGTGLLGGVGTGIWFTDDADAEPAAEAAFDDSRELWHNVPVDTLFPRKISGRGAGPGGADRAWTRVAVAPDSTCRNAFDPLLGRTLRPVGCERLVRATYADETSTSVTTVGIVFTEADATAMRKLRDRFRSEKLAERGDLMPRTYAARGTVSAEFGDAQRGSWTVQVLPDAPAVVYAVAGFADGRTVSDPQPAAEAVEKGETSAPAQAGLGHDARSLADRIERGLRKQLPGDRTEEDT